MQCSVCCRKRLRMQASFRAARKKSPERISVRGDATTSCLRTLPVCVTNSASFRILPVSKILIIRLFVPFSKNDRHFWKAL